jgi:hypothetical protein
MGLATHKLYKNGQLLTGNKHTLSKNRKTLKLSYICDGVRFLG